MGDITLQSASSLAAGSFQSRSLRLLLDLAIWNLLGSLGAPVKRLLAFALFLGRSLGTLVTELQRWALSTIGWLSAPPSLPILRNLGQSFLHTRRWHFGAGMPYTCTKSKEIIFVKSFCQFTLTLLPWKVAVHRTLAVTLTCKSLQASSTRATYSPQD